MFMDSCVCVCVCVCVCLQDIDIECHAEDSLTFTICELGNPLKSNERVKCSFVRARACVCVCECVRLCVCLFVCLWLGGGLSVCVYGVTHLFSVSRLWLWRRVFCSCMFYMLYIGILMGCS